MSADSRTAKTEGADERIVCSLCPHHCRLADGETGFCRARTNEGGAIRCKNYGRLTSVALDPIEKKPLYHFHPGSFIPSVGSFGCNLRCPFCQNYAISMADGQSETQDVTPAELAALAHDLSRRPHGNIGVAFTYNEPLLSYEFIMDAAPLLHEAGLFVVLVTNGAIAPAPLEELLPHVDAMNIDLKGWQPNFYRRLGGDLAAVKHTIARAAKICHVEVTTLIIPGQNDSASDMEEEARWLASLNPDLPLHLSRYFPRWHENTPATPIETIERLAAIARKHLRFVHKGNC